MNCSLLVQTCDNYLEFWKGMVFSLELNWDFNKVPVYWASEELDISTYKFDCRGNDYIPKKFNSVLTGKTDKNGFSTRMRIALENIPSKWVIYMQEDMWLLSNINYQTLDKLLLFAESKNVDAIKIHTKLGYYNAYKLEKTKYFIDGIPLLKYSEGDNFLHSHNATIWNKEYLLKHIVDGEDPWTNEENGSKRMSNESHNHYHYNIHWYSQPGVSEFGKGNSDYYSLGPIFDDRIEFKFKYGNF
jgi:hypothetical protein